MWYISKRGYFVLPCDYLLSEGFYFQILVKSTFIHKNKELTTDSFMKFGNSTIWCHFSFCRNFSIKFIKLVKKPFALEYPCWEEQMYSSTIHRPCTSFHRQSSCLWLIYLTISVKNQQIDWQKEFKYLIPAKRDYIFYTTDFVWLSFRICMCWRN